MLKGGTLATCRDLLLHVSRLPRVGGLGLRGNGYCWRIQKVGKDTTKTKYFSFLVGNINHLSCLEKVEHPYESRIRQQYILKIPTKKQEKSPCANHQVQPH